VHLITASARRILTECFECRNCPTQWIFGFWPQVFQLRKIHQMNPLFSPVFTKQQVDNLWKCNQFRWEPTSRTDSIFIFFVIFLGYSVTMFRWRHTLEDISCHIFMICCLVQPLVFNDVRARPFSVVFLAPDLTSPNFASFRLSDPVPEHDAAHHGSRTVTCPYNFHSALATGAWINWRESRNITFSICQSPVPD